MHRIAFALSALAAGSLLAAPAPPVKPWVRGWDRPVDPLGDCRFDRKGETMTLTVPAREERATAPRLLRDVEGDFVVQVRVGGPFGPGRHRAGLILTAGQTFRFERSGEGLPDRTLGIEKPVQVLVVFGKGGPQKIRHATRNVQVRMLREGPSWEKPATLRLERRGGTLRLSYREDRKEWTPLSESHQVTLPARLKVGVVAEGTGAATFKVVFDQFKLTPLSGAAAAANAPGVKPR
jgi:regulation of enolase protein 1 (concanavalin A-like superfamily)